MSLHTCLAVISHPSWCAVACIWNIDIIIWHACSLICTLWSTSSYNEDIVHGQQLNEHCTCFAVISCPSWGAVTCSSHAYTLIGAIWAAVCYIKKELVLFSDLKNSKHHSDTCFSSHTYTVLLIHFSICIFLYHLPSLRQLFPTHISV